MRSRKFKLVVAIITLLLLSIVLAQGKDLIYLDGGSSWGGNNGAHSPTVLYDDFDAQLITTTTTAIKVTDKNYTDNEDGYGGHVNYGYSVFKFKITTSSAIAINTGFDAQLYTENELDKTDALSDDSELDKGIYYLWLKVEGDGTSRLSQEILELNTKFSSKPELRVLEENYSENDQNTGMDIVRLGSNITDNQDYSSENLYNTDSDEFLDDSKIIINDGGTYNSGYLVINGEYNDSKEVDITATVGSKTKTITKSPGRGYFENELVFDISNLDDGHYDYIEITAENSSGGKVTKIIEVDFTVENKPKIIGLTEDTDSGIKGDGVTNNPINIYIAGRTSSSSIILKVDNQEIGESEFDIDEDGVVKKYILVGMTGDLQEGEHLIKAYSVDSLGNISSNYDEYTVVYDTTPPTSPEIITVSDENDIIENGSSITGDVISINGVTTSGTAVDLLITSDLATEPKYEKNLGYINSNEWEWTFDELDEGTYSIVVNATDAAGNVSNDLIKEDYFSIDLTSPNLTIDGIIEEDDTGELGDNTTRDNNITIQGSVSDSIDTINEVDILLNAIEKGSTNVSNGEWTHSLNELPLGEHTLTIQAADGAGNEASEDYTFTITNTDNDPIEVPNIEGIIEDCDTGKVGDNKTRANMISFKGNAEPNSNLYISVEQIESYEDTNQENEENSINIMVISQDPFPALIEGDCDDQGEWVTESEYFEAGEYSITATSEDAAGNTSNPSNTYEFIIDNSEMTPPKVTGVEKDTGFSDSDFITNDQALDIRGTAEINSSISMYVSQTHPDEVFAELLGVSNAVTADENSEWFYSSYGPLEEGIYYLVPTSSSTKIRLSKKANEPYQTVEIDLTPPEITTSPAIVINSGNSETYNPQVSLNFNVSGAKEIIISNESNFSGSQYELYDSSMTHLLNTDDFGQKTVYVKFRDIAGNETDSYSAEIDLLPAKLTIEYKYSNGSEAASSYNQDIVYGTDYNIQSPRVEGYVPDNETVSGTMNENERLINVTYQKANYTVTFAEVDESIIDTKEALYNETISPPDDPTKAGYTFSGWFSDTSLESQWNFDQTLVTSDITLYAKWTEDENESTSSNNKVDNSVNTSANNESVKSNVSRKRENNNDIINVDFDNETIQDIIENGNDSKNKSIQVDINNRFIETTNIKLNGQSVKELEDNSYNLNIDKNGVKYNLPASEINIDDVAKKLKLDSSALEDVEINIEIAKVKGKALEKYEEVAKNNKNELLIEPVRFNITAKHKEDEDGKEVKINKFKRYVERVIEIPKNLDPNKVTTGIVFNEDGTYNHVPTEVFEVDGVYYARIRSLTNSDYSVINNSIEVPNIEGHWAENTIADLVNRMVITDIDEFNPDGKITRGEFADYITKALGIYRKGVADSSLFADVREGHNLADAITLASEYNIISGYPSGLFKPDQTIVRQEAMAMYARAMDVISFIEEDGNRIESYEDKGEVAKWAYSDVNRVLNARVFNGSSKTNISPLGTFTYAEAATAIRNLLLEAELIKD